MASHSLITKSFKTVKHSKEKTQKKFSVASDGKYYCMNIEMGKQDKEYSCFIMYIFVDQTKNILMKVKQTFKF